MIKSKPSLSKRLLLSTAGMAVLYLPIQQSFAQIEEIVVTSRRIEESISDAPVAVAVMSDEFLRDTQVMSVQNILELTPGGNWGQFAKAQPALGLRGITAGSFGNASLEHAIGIVSDGVPVTKAFMMTLPVYDQERVEVMRGPQGTSFGRNATLGLIHFISGRPSQETSGAIEGSYGERDFLRFRGHYNTALSDTTSGRLAFNFSDIPGAMEDETTGDMYEYSKNSAIRGSLLFEPSDTFTAYVKAEYMSDEDFPTVRSGSEPNIQWLNGNYGSYVTNESPWKTTLSPEPAGKGWVVERDMWNLTGELVWNFNSMDLTSITGYWDGTHYSNSDAFGTPYDIRDQEVDNDAHIFSQEFRLDNHAYGDRLRWLVGASYLTDEEHRIERNESEPLRGNCNSTNPTGCPRNSTLFTDANNTTDAFGIFGEIEYDLSDALTLSVGGRYSSDSRELDFETYGYGSAGGLGGIGLGNPDPTKDCEAIKASPGFTGQCGTPANPVGFADTVSGDWDDFSPKVTLMWALNENNNLYALYSEGFKGGGFQQDARTQSNLNFILKPEGATNIEFGWKGNYENILFAVTLFKQEQTDVQTGNLVVVGSSQANLLVNTAGVENTGIELEATWAPNENFTAGGMISYYDPKFKEGSIIAGRFDAATGAFTGGEDVSGTKPANAVDKGFYVYGQYVWDLEGGSAIRFRADWRYRGDVWGQNGARNRAGLNLAGTGPMYLRPELNKIGLQLGWTSADQAWDVSLWGRNLDDDPDYINYGPGFGYVYLNGAPPNPVRSRPVGSTGRKQVGATVRYNFGG